MTREEVKQKVIEVISEQVAYDQDDPITEDMTLEDLTMDSLDKVEVLMSFEEEYDVNITDEDAEKCVTVKDVVDLMDRVLNPAESEEVSASESDAEEASK
jgi:acyl carrier protein